MKAAGGSVDDFWEYWGVHHYSVDVSEELQKRRRESVEKNKRMAESLKLKRQGLDPSDL